MRYEDENPGEWQVDPKTGERYRMIGRIKEYELMVRVDGIEIPQSQLADYHKRKKEAEQRLNRHSTQQGGLSEIATRSLTVCAESLRQPLTTLTAQTRRSLTVTPLSF